VAFSIAIEPARQDEIVAFVQALDSFLLPLSPPEFHFGLDLEAMDDSATTLLVARGETGGAIAMGALQIHPAGLGEVKRMYVDPAARGQRVGVAVLKTIEVLARENDLHIRNRQFRSHGRCLSPL